MTQRWVKEGSYPTILSVRSDWRKVSAISVVALWLGETDALQTKMFFRLHPDTNVTSNLIRDFLHQARLQVDGKMTSYGTVHLSIRPNRIEGFFERYDRMDEIHIPIACPELNPCEGVWDWSKLNDMWNVTPQGFEELISRTRLSLTKLQHRDYIYRWCYH